MPAHGLAVSKLKLSGSSLIRKAKLGMLERSPRYTDPHMSRRRSVLMWGGGLAALAVFVINSPAA